MKGLQDFGSPAVDGWLIRKHHLPKESLYASVIVWGDYPDESMNRDIHLSPLHDFIIFKASRIVLRAPVKS